MPDDMAGGRVVRFGDVQVGDVMVGADGSPVCVTACYDTHVPDDMFCVRTVGGDGRVVEVEASGNHLWYVVPDFDARFHLERCRVARKSLACMSSGGVSALGSVADGGGDVAGSVADMMAVCGMDMEDSRLAGVFCRVAASLGPIEEDTSTFVDMATGEHVCGGVVPMYDAVAFARQVLALRAGRHRDVVVGRVLTTRELVWWGEVGDLTVPELVQSTS